MIVSLVYHVARKLLAVPAVLLRRCGSVLPLAGTANPTTSAAATSHQCDELLGGLVG
jgi:hypothetical protein